MHRKLTEYLKRVLSHNFSALSFMCVFSFSANAVVVDISADFMADYNNPNKMEFTNTTPLTGVCSQSHRPTCEANGWWSISVMNDHYSGQKIGGGSATTDMRKAMYVNMPGPRKMTIRSLEDGSQSEVTLLISGAALRYNNIKAPEGSTNVTDLTNSPQGPCHYGIRGYGADSSMRMFLRNDNGEGASAACSTRWLKRGEMNLVHFDIVYRLITPDPYALSPGRWEGVTTYTIGGPGADFDLGDDVSSLSTTQFTARVSLTVSHVFHLTPPENPLVELRPQTTPGLRSGSPEYTGDVGFELITSIPGRVRVQCETMINGECGLKSINGHKQFPLAIRLTMPGLYGRTGQPMDGVLLKPGSSAFFAPGKGRNQVVKSSGKLSFTLLRETVAAMGQSGQEEYEGGMTFIFDSEFN